MTIGENIRRIRKSKKMTIQKLADKAGYVRNQIHRIETDKQIPKVSTVIDIADVLEVSLDELVGRDFKNCKKPVEKFPFDCCPKCDSVVSQLNKYCSQCGQALDWSDHNASNN